MLSCNTIAIYSHDMLWKLLAKWDFFVLRREVVQEMFLICQKFIVWSISENFLHTMRRIMLLRVLVCDNFCVRFMHNCRILYHFLRKYHTSLRNHITHEKNPHKSDISTLSIALASLDSTHFISKGMTKLILNNNLSRTTHSNKYM